MASPQLAQLIEGETISFSAGTVSDANSSAQNAFREF
jgi:hypothetical protein